MPSCMCTAPVMLLVGVLICGKCETPLESENEGSNYSTAVGCWPRRAKNRRHARDLIRAVAGHEQSGTGRGTQWEVRKALYHAHHTRRPALRLVPPPPGDMTDAESDARARRAMDAVGLRATKAAKA